MNENVTGSVSRSKGVISSNNGSGLSLLSDKEKRLKKQNKPVRGELTKKIDAIAWERGFIRPSVFEAEIKSREDYERIHGVRLSRSFLEECQRTHERLMR